LTPGDRSADLLAQITPIEGLGDVIERAELGRRDDGRDVDHGGDENDLDHRVQGLHAPEHGQAIHVRHPDVEEHDVDRIGAEDVERGRAAVRHERIEFLFEEELQAHAHGLVVVDDQHDGPIRTAIRPTPASHEAILRRRKVPQSCRTAHDSASWSEAHLPKHPFHVGSSH
jgi:hypothetical protein